MKKSRDGWYTISATRTLVGVPHLQTRSVGNDTYATDAKADEVEKHQFNRYVCDIVIDLYGFWRSIRVDAPTSRALILDAPSMLTFRYLSTFTALPTHMIDVVSQGTLYRESRAPHAVINDEKRKRFDRAKGESKVSASRPHLPGALVTGSLSAWMRERVPPNVGYYDIAILDFCSTFHNADTQLCIRLLFERFILDEVSVLVVTFAKRDNHGTSYLHQNSFDSRNFIADTAREFGYAAHLLYVHYNTDVFSLYFKILLPCQALHKTSGLAVPTASRECVDAWQLAPFARTVLEENAGGGSKKRQHTVYPFVDARDIK